MRIADLMIFNPNYKNISEIFNKFADLKKK